MTKIPAIEKMSPIGTYYGYKKGSTSKRSPGYEHSKNNNDKFGQTLKKASKAVDNKTDTAQKAESEDKRRINVKV